MNVIYSNFVNNFILPIYDITKGTYRFKYGRVLEKTQWLSRKNVEVLQQKNLLCLIKHAYETVPYYRRIFKEKRLNPNDIKNVSDLLKLPVLSKKDIQKEFNALLSRSFQKNNLIPYQSGGTGDQIKFNITKNQLSWEVAAEFRAYGWAGYKLGNRCLLIWGSSSDLSKNRNLLKRVTKKIERIVIKNAYILSDQVLNDFANTAKKNNPEIIRGYASSIYMFAKYCLENNIKNIRPKAVITSAENLLDFRRKIIEEAFECPVFDYYGSREIGALAAECEEHEGYHISAENVVIEFVKDGEHVAAGESGVIVVTNLRNFGMPFIRYVIGDVGKPSNEVCTCGRGLPLISSIDGRTSEFMAVYDEQLGRVVPVISVAPGIIGGLLMYVPLERHRIIQESLNRIVIRAVKGKGYTKKHTDFLMEHLRNYLGNNITIEFDFVNYLPPLPSGKRSVFVSKINPFEQYL